MSKPQRIQLPRIVRHRFEVPPRFPLCEADVQTAETIRWRMATQNSRDARRRAEKGAEMFQCGNYASYTIDEHWYCKKHAALIALDLLTAEQEP